VEEDKSSPTLLCERRGQIAKKEIPLVPPLQKGDERGIWTRTGFGLREFRRRSIQSREKVYLVCLVCLVYLVERGRSSRSVPSYEDPFLDLPLQMKNPFLDLPLP
jgi:hypothetical protein